MVEDRVPPKRRGSRAVDQAEAVDPRFCEHGALPLGWLAQEPTRLPPTDHPAMTAPPVEPSEASRDPGVATASRDPHERHDAPEETASGREPSDDASAPVLGHLARGWPRHLGWLAANLAVVFAGVYAAFHLDRLQGEERDRERAAAFEHSLAREFASTADSLAAQGKSMEEEFVDPFLEALDAGERPPLLPLPFAVGELDTGTWRALMTAGGIELLDPATILEVDSFYSTVRSMLGNLERFERLCDQYLIPELGTPAESFYDEDGALLPRWRWYEQHLRHLPASVSGIARWARSLAGRFGATGPGGPTGDRSPPP
jgi:hypothetical protein